MKLFWKELKQTEGPQKCRFGRGTVWASLDKVSVDAARLEHLFESKAKELPVAKVTEDRLTSCCIYCAQPIRRSELAFVFSQCEHCI